MSGAPEFRTHPTPLADLGVLFVHGIGRQRYGECLTRSASPVCEALIRWAVSARPSSAADSANEELAAAVSPISAKSPGLPATVTLTIATDVLGDGTGHTWLLAESLWSDRLIHPPAPHFARWLVRLTRQVLADLCAALRLHVRHPKLADSPGIRTLYRTDHGPHSLMMRARYGSWLARAKLVSLGAACLVGRHTQRTWDGLLEKVGTDLEWLLSRSARVVIVAHSLGASITTGLLAANGIPDKLGLLVTYGASCSGIEPYVADLPMLWLDFAADRDPFAGASARGSVRMNICNERSAISDHWAYWRNTEEFVFPLLSALVHAELRPVELASENDQRRIAVAQADRRYRVSVLQAARLSILLSGLTAFLALSAAGAGRGSVLVAAALVAALGLARRTWRRWDARSRKCVLARDVAVTNRRVMSWAWMAAAFLPMAFMTATLTLHTDWRGHEIAWYVSVPLTSLVAIASVQLVLVRPKRLACPESDLLPAPRSE